MDLPLGPTAKNAPPLAFVRATVTIANGASLSDALDCQGLVPVAVLAPAAWTTAVVTFQASYNGTTYGSVYDANGEVSYPAAAGLWLALNPAQFAGLRYLKVRSGTAGSAVNQAAERSIVVILRSVG